MDLMMTGLKGFHIRWQECAQAYSSFGWLHCRAEHMNWQGGREAHTTHTREIGIIGHVKPQGEADDQRLGQEVKLTTDTQGKWYQNKTGNKDPKSL